MNNKDEYRILDPLRVAKSWCSGFYSVFQVTGVPDFGIRRRCLRLPRSLVVLQELLIFFKKAPDGMIVPLFMFPSLRQEKNSYIWRNRFSNRNGIHYGIAKPI